MLHKGFTLWFTGLSGSGKTTISNLVHHRLQEEGITNVEILDGETVESLFSKGFGFTREDTDMQTKRLGWVAHVLTKHGVPNLVAAVSPSRDSRDEVRAMVEHAGGRGSFIEVYVDCPVELCEERDKRGIYLKAKEGEAKHVAGVDEPYEKPHGPEVHLRTGESAPEECAEAVFGYLREKGLVSS